jgi:2-isopropylmalate synthase
VRFLKKHGKEVIYDAEHFFDGYRDDPDYALRTLAAAAEAGADALVPCDTNGGRLTSEVAEIVATGGRAVSRRAGGHPRPQRRRTGGGQLAGGGAGRARMVQGTINGYGERTGNANLCSIIPGLALKLGADLTCKPRLDQLRRVSTLLDEIADQRPLKSRPYEGESAFAHKAGMHVDAVGKVSKSFEHIEPEAVGNERRILMSELSGASNVRLKTGEMAWSSRRFAGGEGRPAQAGAPGE